MVALDGLEIFSFSFEVAGLFDFIGQALIDYFILGSLFHFDYNINESNIDSIQRKSLFLVYYKDSSFQR